MSQSLSRRSFLKCAGSGAVSLAAALLTGVSAAAAQPRVMGQPALLDGKAAVELLGYAPEARASPAAALRHRSTRRTPPMPRPLRSTSPPGAARCSIASALSRRIGRRWS